MLYGAIINGFIHLMVVVLVTGGSFFMNFILPKTIKDLSPQEQGRIKSMSGKYFGMMAWIAIVLATITGVARSIALGLFTPGILFGTSYGLLLVGKIVLFVWLIINSAFLTKTGIIMEKAAAAEGGPAMDIIHSGELRIHKLSMSNEVLAVIIILFAVAMRIIGIPTE